MQSHHRSDKNKFIEKSIVVGKGTAIGIFGRWATWPLEKAYYDASAKSNTKSYAQIYRDIYKPRSLYQLNKIFFKTGFLQTIGKSASNMGVINYVEHYHSHLSSLQKGMLGASLCVPLETTLTSRGEYRKVQNFLHLQQKNALPIKTSAVWTRDFARVMAASCVRIYWAGVITFCGIYETAKQIKPLFPAGTSDAVIKALAATSSSFLAQPIIMPAINFQTYILTNPSQSFGQSVRSFVKDHTAKDLFRGTLGRSINRGVYYGLTFFIAESVKKLESAEPPKKINSPSSSSC